MKIFEPVLPARLHQRFSGAAQLNEHHFALLRSVITGEFLSFAQDQARQYWTDMERQYAADPTKVTFERDFILPDLDPSGVIADICSFVGDLTGTSEGLWTMAEAHLKGYLPAITGPGAHLHKDRLASEIAIGIPLTMPATSRLVFYTIPGQMDENLFSSSAEHRGLLDPSSRPELLFHDDPGIQVSSDIGDAIVFRGSRLFHGRLSAGGAMILYLKLNSLGLDPMGHDPRTEPQREASLDLAMDAIDENLASCRVALSPYLVEVTRKYSRSGPWREFVIACVAGRRNVLLSPEEWSLVSRCAKLKPMSDLAGELGDHLSSQDLLRMIRKLTRLAVLTLIKPDERGSA